MKYAVISDIHGNAPALEAVLADAEKKGVDRYLALGDYTAGFPWGNEVVDRMCGIPSITAVRGNGEGYLMDSIQRGTVEDAYEYEQFKPVYWARHTLSKDNLEYVTALPATADVQDDGVGIHLVHSLDAFYRSPKVAPFHVLSFRGLMEEKPFSHEEYLEMGREAILSCPAAVSDIRQLPKGIYLYGHNHLQFYMEYEGRAFINPGACGEPLDRNTTTAYTILVVEDGKWKISEQRVGYDVEATVQRLRASEYTSYAPVWSKVMENELREGKDYFTPLVHHLMETGRKMGRTEFPVNNDVWREAVASWGDAP